MSSEQSFLAIKTKIKLPLLHVSNLKCPVVTFILHIIRMFLAALAVKSIFCFQTLVFKEWHGALMEQKVITICSSKASRNPFYAYKFGPGELGLVVCGEQLIQSWMQAWMFFCHVFIGPLVKGSNRYQDARACFRHDTSPVFHKKKKKTNKKIVFCPSWDKRWRGTRETVVMSIKCK